MRKGYLTLDKQLLSRPETPWQFVWAEFQYASGKIDKNHRPERCKSHEGDIFALQLRGHIAFA
jgi:hypothetical protein